MSTNTNNNNTNNSLENESFRLTSNHLLLTYHPTRYQKKENLNRELIMLELIKILKGYGLKIKYYFITQEMKKNEYIKYYNQEKLRGEHFHIYLYIEYIDSSTSTESRQINIRGASALDLFKENTLEKIHGNYRTIHQFLKKVDPSNYIKYMVDNKNIETEDIIKKIFKQGLSGHHQVLIYLLKQNKNPYTNLPSNVILSLEKISENYLILENHFKSELIIENPITINLKNDDEYYYTEYGEKTSLLEKYFQLEINHFQSKQENIQFIEEKRIEENENSFLLAKRNNNSLKVQNKEDTLQYQNILSKQLKQITKIKTIEQFKKLLGFQNTKLTILLVNSNSTSYFQIMNHLKLINNSQPFFDETTNKNWINKIIKNNTNVDQTFVIYHNINDKSNNNLLKQIKQIINQKNDIFLQKSICTILLIDINQFFICDLDKQLETIEFINYMQKITKTNFLALNDQNQENQEIEDLRILLLQAFEFTTDNAINIININQQNNNVNIDINIETLNSENINLKELNNEYKERIEILKKEKHELFDSIEYLKKENQSLKQAKKILRNYMKVNGEGLLNSQMIQEKGVGIDQRGNFVDFTKLKIITEEQYLASYEQFQIEKEKEENLLENSNK